MRQVHDAIRQPPRMPKFYHGMSIPQDSVNQRQIVLLSTVAFEFAGNWKRTTASFCFRILAHMDQITMGLHEEHEVLRYLIQHAIDARRAGN